MPPASLGAAEIAGGAEGAEGGRVDRDLARRDHAEPRGWPRSRRSSGRAQPRLPIVVFTFAGVALLDVEDLRTALHFPMPFWRVR